MTFSGSLVCESAAADSTGEAADEEMGGVDVVAEEVGVSEGFGAGWAGVLLLKRCAGFWLGRGLDLRRCGLLSEAGSGEKSPLLLR
jgi:hypothetical protein